MNEENAYEKSGAPIVQEGAATRARGGLARAAKLSPEARKAIASEAAKRRWATANEEVSDLPKLLPGFKAVLPIGGKKLPCAVIQGKNGIQRVLSETGIANAILGGRSGASIKRKREASAEGDFLPVFLAPERLSQFINPEIHDGPLTPVDYIDGDRIIRAYDASVLPIVCDIWLRAREAGALQKQQLSRAQAAEILTRSLAQTGIVALIDEATGYESARPQNALQIYIEQIIRKELAAWVKKFPDEFYENIYKLKGWKWPGMQKNRFSIVAHYTRDLVYQRLGPGILRELESKTPKNETGNRSHKFQQWLTEDVGDPMLAQHLHTLVMFQRLALANGHGWNKFLQSVDAVLPKYSDELVLPLEPVVYRDPMPRMTLPKTEEPKKIESVPVLPGLED